MKEEILQKIDRIQEKYGDSVLYEILEYIEKMKADEAEAQDG